MSVTRRFVTESKSLPSTTGRCANRNLFLRHVEQRQRVDRRGTRPVQTHFKMQMCRTCVARRTHDSDHVATRDDAPDFETGLEGVEMVIPVRNPKGVMKDPRIPLRSRARRQTLVGNHAIDASDEQPFRPIVGRENIDAVVRARTERLTETPEVVQHDQPVIDHDREGQKPIETNSPRRLRRPCRAICSSECVRARPTILALSPLVAQSGHNATRCGKRTADDRPDNARNGCNRAQS
jgi:hypothetical protein